VAQQIYAFAWGLAYVWLMERSRSLLAPMIAHGLSDAVEVGAVMALMAAWG
jgi:membrane protease YdiL (CAAX protease family)